MPTINKIEDLIEQIYNIPLKKIIFVAPNVHKMLYSFINNSNFADNTDIINLISKYVVRVDGTLNDNEYYINEEEYEYTITLLEGIKTNIKGLIDNAEKNPKSNENTSGYWKRFSELNNAIQILQKQQKSNQLKLQ